MIDLSKVTFTIPVRIDCVDREKNLYLVLRYLNKYFKTNIEVMEVLKHSEKSNLGYLKEKNLCNLSTTPYREYFDKSYFLNILIKNIKTPYGCIYDTDVLLPPKKYTDSLTLLENEKAGIIIGFDGRIFEVLKSNQRSLRNTLDHLNIDLKKTVKICNIAQGGCVMFSLKAFKKIGLMNENIKSHGGEDDELISRAKTLGVQVIKLPGPIFHLSHFRTSESSWECKGTPKHRNNNLKELRDVRAMTKQQLQEYINTWEWRGD